MLSPPCLWCLFSRVVESCTQELWSSFSGVLVTSLTEAFFAIVQFAVNSEKTPACSLQTCSPVSELRRQIHLKSITEENYGS